MIPKSRCKWQSLAVQVPLVSRSGGIALFVALVELLSLPNALGAQLQGPFWSAVDAANDHFEFLGIVSW